jgi:monovalent cation/hydrogen antiporter
VVEGLEQAVVLVAVVFVMAAVARRFGLLAPILLILAGLVLSFIPGFPSVAVNPDVILIGVLPPLLYVAALETSVPAFRVNLRPILLLAVGLVVFTTAAVGLVVHLLLPDVPLAICFALGAVLAPTDAISATAIGRKIGLPRRIVTILEGESLVNDASALVLFRVAVAAAVGSTVSAGGVTVDFLLAAGGGLVIGALFAVVIGALHQRITDPLLDNTLSLLTPFIVVIPAQLAHASGVVAVVVVGLALGHRWPTLMSAASRLQMEAFWRVVNFLLEGAVFLVTGLQLRMILRSLQTPTAEVVGITAAVLGTVILARFIWMYPATYLPRFLVPAIRRRDPYPHLNVPTLLAWAGMRGVVTLATALALPATLAHDRSYPRELFVWLAFAVIVGSLLLQSTTLPMAARLLRIQPDDPTLDLLAEASVQNRASRAAKKRMEELAEGTPEPVIERLRSLAIHRSNLAWERLGQDGRETPTQAYKRVRREMLEVEREVFRSARDQGQIAEQVLRRAQRDLDLEESMLERTGD